MPPVPLRRHAGRARPLHTDATFRRLRARTDLELEFHGHDDLGLATANTLAALRGGALHASVCVLGLGERAGNAALEQVAAAIPRLGMGVRATVMAELTDLAEVVAAAACRTIPHGQPIVGETAFTHESGIHVSGLLRDPAPMRRWTRRCSAASGRSCWASTPGPRPCAMRWPG